MTELRLDVTLSTDAAEICTTAHHTYNRLDERAQVHPVDQLLWA